MATPRFIHVCSELLMHVNAIHTETQQTHTNQIYKVLFRALSTRLFCVWHPGVPPFLPIEACAEILHWLGPWPAGPAGNKEKRRPHAQTTQEAKRITPVWKKTGDWNQGLFDERKFQHSILGATAPRLMKRNRAAWRVESLLGKQPWLVGSDTQEL